MGKHKINPHQKTFYYRDFPDGLVVKNLPSNAEDAGVIPDLGTKISHAAGPLSCPPYLRSPHALELRHGNKRGPWVPQLEEKSLWVSRKIQHSQEKRIMEYDPAIPLLGIYSNKAIIWKDTYTPIFITAPFTISKTWKQPKCPSTEEWIKKIG